MEASSSVRIGDETGVGAARREAARLSRAVELDEQAAGRLAIVVTELGNNVWKHAHGGELLLRAIDAGVELCALDKGPGMSDVAVAMDDGYSTSGTAGTGLGAVRRQSQTLDIYSLVGAGTAVVARVLGGGAPASMPAIAGVSVAKLGEEIAGDHWTSTRTGARTIVLVADGLGHGPDAAMAARAATRVVHEQSTRTPVELLQAAHEALRTTRGAACAVALLDSAAGELVFAGVGNVFCQIVHGDGATAGLASSYGTVGGDLPRVREQRLPFAASDGLILATDGVRPKWRWSSYPALWRHDPAIVAGVVYRDFAVSHDDATVVIARMAQP